MPSRQIHPAQEKHQRHETTTPFKVHRAKFYLWASTHLSEPGMQNSSAFPKARRAPQQASSHPQSPSHVTTSSCILVLSPLSIYRGNWANSILPLCYFVLSSSGNMLSQQRHSAEPCQVPFSAGCLAVNCM